MKLILVRHGETDRNKNKQLKVAGPVGINENGQQQIEAAAQRLAQEKIDIIFSSDMRRAIQSTDLIANFHPTSVRRADHELREQDNGV